MDAWLADPDILFGEESRLWEIFHENTKAEPFHGLAMSPEEMSEYMADLFETMRPEGYPVLPLPSIASMPHSALWESVCARKSVRDFGQGQIRLDDLSLLLYGSYGVTREKTATARAMRTVPSGGALYPLELLVYAHRVCGLSAGVYWYDPTSHSIALSHGGDHLEDIAAVYAQPDLIRQSSMLMFITAVFERTTRKYGDRGYRYVLLEAGHLAQNANLLACSLGIPSVNLCGYHDRDLDEYLGLDGLRHSVIYSVCFGMPSEGAVSAAQPWL